MNENAQIPLPLPSNGMSVVVSSPRLLRGDRIDRLGVKYEFLEREPTRKKFLRVDTDAMVWIDNIELVSQMARREITIALPDWLPAARARKWGQDFYSMPETDKLRARMRLAYVEAFLENRRLGYPQKVRALLDDVHRKRMQDPKAVEAGEWKPCLAAVYEWVEIWEAPKGPKGIKRLCFAESERGVRGVQVEDSIAPLLHTAIKDLWFTSQRTRVKHVFDRVITDARAAGIPDVYYPSERTVRRAINGLPPYAVARARLGLRAAEEEYRSKGQLPPTPLPGQVYELDAHKLDFVAVDDRFGLPLGRLWITAVIDRCTRVIVGFHLHVEPPSSLTVAAALRNAFAPKLYMLQRWPQIGRPWVAWGMPQLIILDNGLENHAVFLQEALEELDVQWFYAPPRTPEFKPHIERWFLTAVTDFSGRLPGRTGSNPKDRGDYDTEGMACIALADADELLHRWVVLYNLAFHQGIRDIPERLWLEKTAELEVAPIDDIGMLDIVLGEYAIRTPTKKGIFLAGLRYGDLGDNRPVELIRTRAGAANLGKVRIRFDRNDLSHIWLQDPLTKEYHCVASLDPQYTSGLTLAQHRMIRRYAVERAGKYVSIHELCVGRDELQRRISAMCGDEGVTARRAVAMYNGIGSKGSWADFYRMAEAEYGKDRNENMTRSIARLLEAEIDDEIPGGIPVVSVKGARPATGAHQAAAQPAGEDAVAEPAREQPAVERTTPEEDEQSRVAALRKRMSDLGTDVEGL